MSTRTAATREWKNAQIIDVLRKNPGVYMHSADIREKLLARGVDIPVKTISNYASLLKSDYPELTAIPRRGFVWNAEEAEFYNKKASDTTENKSSYRKKNTAMQNAEGYSDPTAGSAIRNVEGDDPYARIGEVWTTKESSGLIGYYMIISDWGSLKMGVPLYAEDSRNRIRFSVEVGGAKFFGDATNFKTKPTKYLDRWIGCVDRKKCMEVLDKIFSAIADPSMSPVVIEKLTPANTIEVDGKLYTEADVKSKLDTIDILQSDLENTEKEREELREEVKCAIEKMNDLKKENEALENNVFLHKSAIEDLKDANNGVRTALISAKKNKPVIVQVDGEIYNEEDITAIIRARNTVRVGDKIYKASDIIALEEGNYIAEDSDVNFASDMTADMNYLIQQNAEYKIYKQFFEAYCRGLARGEDE